MAGIENSAVKQPKKFTDRMNEVRELQEKIEGKKPTVEQKGKSFKDYFREMNALAKGK